MGRQLHNKKILFLSPAFIAGGVEGFILESAEAVIKAGGKTIVASAGGRMVEPLNRIGGKHYVVPFKKSWQRIFPLLIFFYLAKIIKKEKIDLIYTGSRGPAWYGWWLKKIYHIPLITGFHGNYSGMGFPPKKFYNSVMVRGDVIHAVSDYTHRFLTEHFHPKNPVVVIKGGVDTQEFDPKKITHQDKKNIHLLLQKTFADYKPSDRIIFMAGRVTKLKGHKNALKVFSQLLQNQDRRFQDVKFIMQTIGKKKILRTIRNFIRQHNLSDKIGFLPPLDNLRAIYGQVDIVLNASTRPEPFNRTGLEAMAMERVVIAPNYGGFLEQVNDGVNGFLYVANDSASLQKTILSALQLNDSQKKIIGKMARQTIIQKLSLPDKKRELINLFKRVIDQYQ